MIRINKYNLVPINALLLLFVACSEQIVGKEGFILNGEINGKSTKYITLNYIDKNEEVVQDTIKVENGQFSAKGNINGGTRAILNGNMESETADDPNIIYFFLEPTKMNISIIEGKFKDANIVGSKTQEEYEGFSKRVASIYKKMDPLGIEIDELMNQRKKSDVDVMTIEAKLKKLRSRSGEILDEVKDQGLKFASERPNSHLSAYFIDNDFTRISIDSALAYYDSFSPEVKSGIYGKELKLKIDKSKTSSMRGDKAPNFELTDLKENKLSLEQFRGRYVLLDFWASWCGPCREHNPDLIQIHKSYHSKGLEIIGLTSDRDRSKWKKAIKDDGIGIWHHAFSGKNRVAINTEYDITAIPAYILIDQDGYIIDRYLAADNQKLGLDELEKKLKELFRR